MVFLGILAIFTSITAEQNPALHNMKHGAASCALCLTIMAQRHAVMQRKLIEYVIILIQLQVPLS